jgi:medium-chain acyl-CoA synthetase
LHRWEITIATLRIGAVITPATMMLANSDIEFRCQQTRAKVFIGNDASVEKALRVRSSCPDLKTIICIHENAKRNEDVVDFKETMRSMPPDARVKEVKTKAEDPSIIFFTSGTSGPPKMVRHNQVSCPLGTKSFVILSL